MLGFDHPKFRGEIIAEPEKLRESSRRLPARRRLHQPARLVEIGLTSSEDAEKLHAIETAAVAAAH